MNRADDTPTKVQKNKYVRVVFIMERDIDHRVIRQLTSSPLPFISLEIFLFEKEGIE